MSHYAKLATLFLRLTAIGFLLIGGLGLLYYLGGAPDPNRGLRLLSSLMCALFGTVLLPLSKLFGDFLTRDL